MNYLGINNSETMFSVGSTSGLINIYDRKCQEEGDFIKPVKTIKNLRAPVTLQIFNSSDEIALFASECVKGQTKLFHAKSRRKIYTEIFYAYTKLHKVSYISVVIIILL